MEDIALCVVCLLCNSRSRQFEAKTLIQVFFYSTNAALHSGSVTKIIRVVFHTQRGFVFINAAYVGVTQL